MKTNNAFRIKFFGFFLIFYGIFLLSAEDQDLFSAKIFLSGTNRNELLFTYKNTIAASGNYRIFTHDFISTDGNLFTREQVTLNKGELIKHTIDFYELDEHSIIEKKGGDLIISFQSNRINKSKTIPYQDGIIFGPTQQEFIRQNLSRFSTGEILPFIVPAPEYTSLVIFTMQKLENTLYNRPGVMVLKMETKNIFLRLLVSEITFVVNDKTGTILEIHGPSILQRKVNGKWKNFDADIYFEYP